MNRFWLGAMFVSAVALTPVGVPSLHAQQTVAVPNPSTAACGVNGTELKMKRDGRNAGTTSPPADKALVYVIEQMPAEGPLTTQVKLGVDGSWLAQLSGQTFTSFTLDPGVHHLCAHYEGKVAASQLDATILHRLDAEKGKTYYLLYRGFLTRDAGEVGWFDLVDEDEGQYALQTAEHLAATVAKP